MLFKVKWGEEFSASISLAEFENNVFVAFPCKLELALISLLFTTVLFVTYEAMGDLRLFPLPIMIICQKGIKVYCRAPVPNEKIFIHKQQHDGVEYLEEKACLSVQSVDLKAH
jgi:hypothetical protein